MMNPDEKLSSTGYCLAKKGEVYIVYSEEQKDFEVNDLQAGREYLYEWISTAEARVLKTGRIIPDAGIHQFSPGFSKAVLFLKLRDI